MAIDLLIGAIKAIVILLLVLQPVGRAAMVRAQGQRADSGSRRRQPRRISSASASGSGLPNLGLQNTLMADPLKLFTKEDFVPEGADKFLHALGPFLALFPVLVRLRWCRSAILPARGPYRRTSAPRASTPARCISSRPSASACMASRSADGPRTIDGRCWARVRATAQMISYEIAMGLAIISHRHHVRHARFAGHRAPARRRLVRISAAMGDFPTAGSIHDAD